MTDEDIVVDLLNTYHDTKAGHRYAAVVKRARELLCPPAPTRQDVPGVEEIYSIFRAKSFAQIPKSMIEVFTELCLIHARVAHAMMLEMAPRERRLIDGMTVEDILGWLMVNCDLSRPDTTVVAAQVYRLANTPAPKVDPDAKAKRLAWEYEQTKNVGWQGYSVDVLWQALSTEAKDGWRADAKQVKS